MKNKFLMKEQFLKVAKIIKFTKMIIFKRSKIGARSLDKILIFDAQQIKNDCFCKDENLSIRVYSE